MGSWLAEWQHVWRPRAFYGLPLPWEVDYPDVVAFLDSLPSDLTATPAAAHDGFDEDGVLDDGHWTSGGPAILREWAAAGARLGALPTFTQPSPHGVALALPEMTARKSSQLQAFIETVTTVVAETEPTHIVDWCAGKGHLGRELARRAGLPLLSLELQPPLCAEARRLAAAAGVPATVLCGDALGDGAEALMATPGAHTGLIVALHACGDLHGALISRFHGTALALAPCCYTRAVDGGQARLLSETARRTAARAGLVIDERDLRLVHEQVSETGARELNDVRRRQAYRLGFDAWLRSRGATDYTPVPAIPLSATRLGFTAFGERLAEAAGLPAPGPTLAEFEADGWRRLEAVTRRDLVRSLFRAPLEAFLVHDRARALEERGYEVSVGTFCSRAVTPRNRLIVARTPTPCVKATSSACRAPASTASAAAIPAPAPASHAARHSPASPMARVLPC